MSLQNNELDGVWGCRSARIMLVCNREKSSATLRTDDTIMVGDIISRNLIKWVANADVVGDQSENFYEMDVDMHYKLYEDGSLSLHTMDGNLFGHLSRMEKT